MNAVTISFLIMSWVLLTGCTESEATSKADLFTPQSTNQSDRTNAVSLPEEVATPTSSSVSKDVVAIYGDKTLLLDELDSYIQIALFDLEWRKYQLRKETLANLLGTKIPSQKHDASVTVLLAPPTPPRIELPVDKRPIIGDSSAPIELSIFCSYQSAHCGRLNVIIRELLEQYGSLINMRFYDYPQRFHRYGYTAANAVHCAHEQGEMAAYQSAVYMDQQSLENARLLLIAEQLKLDMATFRQCTETGRYAANIDADLALGKSLGLGNVPIVFINGLYAKGPQTAAAYSYYVDQELSRLNISQPSLVDVEPVESQLPLALIATTISSDPSLSIAQIVLAPGESEQAFRTGDFLLENVKLVEIDERQVYIENESRLEYIRLRSYQDQGRNQDQELDELIDQASVFEQANSLYETVPGAPGREEGARPYRELPSTGEMTISKEWIEQQLQDRHILQRKFHLADHVVQGVHLVKLHGVQDDRFYNTLGLREGDVLMRVNDQWVHEEQNPLWSALEDNEQISIQLMRKGLPVRYDYVIK